MEDRIRLWRPSPRDDPRTGQTNGHARSPRGSSSRVALPPGVKQLPTGQHCPVRGGPPPFLHPAKRNFLRWPAAFPGCSFTLAERQGDSLSCWTGAAAGAPIQKDPAGGDLTWTGRPKKPTHSPIWLPVRRAARPEDVVSPGRIFGCAQWFRPCIPLPASANLVQLAAAKAGQGSRKQVCQMVSSVQAKVGMGPEHSPPQTAIRRQGTAKWALPDLRARDLP